MTLVEPDLPPGIRHSDALTHGNRLSAIERRNILQGMEAVGQRMMPFTFESAVAVVSDVDGSTRSRYEAYVGYIVRHLGLDFGDSMWLAWRKFLFSRTDGVTKVPGLGFFSYMLEAGDHEPESMFYHTRTLRESVAEFHLGNVDHFHSFLSRGPGLSLHRTREENGTAVARPEGFVRKGKMAAVFSHVVAVCVVGSEGLPNRVASVKVEENTGSAWVFDQPMDMPNPPNSRPHSLLRMSAAAGPHRDAPLLSIINEVVVRFDDDMDARHVQYILLITALGDVVIQSLRGLRDEFGVSTPLVTEHSGRHFRNFKAGPILDRQFATSALNENGRLMAWSGTAVDGAGVTVFTTEADDPRSFCQVIPTMIEDLEYRFVNPAGLTASLANGWNLLDLITPAMTRAQSAVYVARRTLPNIKEPLPGQPFDGTWSHHDSFVQRIKVALDDCAANPGLAWPIYTHLGGLSKSFTDHLQWDRPGEPTLPDPFFEPGPLEQLQDRVFGISPEGREGDRLWFTRASVLYDYSLMVRSLAPHVQRSDARTIEITSWDDPILEQRMPRGPAQLYGATFYVDDPTATRVLLDDQPIDEVVINPPDKTGRPSVTIVQADIRHQLLGSLPPDPDQVAGEVDQWSWIAETDSDPAHLSLPAPADGVASIRLPQHGRVVSGAQVLAFSAMTDPGTEIAVVLKTETGGTFAFGNGKALEYVAEPTASKQLGRHGTTWRRHALALHDMVWADDAKPGGPMPNHPLSSVTLIATTQMGEPVTARFADIVLTRPRTADPATHNRHVLAGYVPTDENVDRVHLTSQDDVPITRTTTVDQRGQFVFSGLPAGVYQVWAEVDDRRLQPVGGPLVEVTAPVVGVSLRG